MCVLGLSLGGLISEVHMEGCARGCHWVMEVKDAQENVTFKTLATQFGVLVETIGYLFL